jgi:hypothetical protein
MQLITETRKKINPYYELTIGQLTEIYEANPGVVERMSNSFIYGYAQGVKAAKAEARRKAREANKKSMNPGGRQGNEC